MGIFGNADINLKYDWIKVLNEQASTGVGGKTKGGTYDAARRICNKHDSLQVEILYSHVGYEDDP